MQCLLLLAVRGCCVRGETMEANEHTHNKNNTHFSVVYLFTTTLWDFYYHFVTSVCTNMNKVVAIIMFNGLDQRNWSWIGSSVSLRRILPFLLTTDELRLWQEVLVNYTHWNWMSSSAARRVSHFYNFVGIDWKSLNCTYLIYLTRH